MNLITTAEAAERLKVSQVLIQRWIRTGKLPATRVNSRMWLINPDDLKVMAKRDRKRGPKKRDA